MCCDNRISYTNHPNSNSCEINDNNKENVLQVGVCQYFPGPADSWKFIDASSYTCNTSTTCPQYSAASSVATASTFVTLALGLSVLVLA
jgi:hypothetical protein